MKLQDLAIVSFIACVCLAVFCGFFVIAGEPVEKAPDSFYDKSLHNTMRLADIPAKEIEILMSLPTSPEVDIDSAVIVENAQWFFVSPDLDVGIVFRVGNNCDIKGLVVFDLRDRKK